MRTIPPVIIVLSIAGALWVTKLRRPYSWAEFTAHVDAVEARHEAETGDREPLAGPPVEGNAWDDYAIAYAEGAPSLDALRAGCRRTRAKQPAQGGLVPPRVVEGLRTALVKEARAHREEGRLDAALDEIACCLQSGADAARAPYALPTGLWTMHDGLHELHAVLTDLRATVAQVERVERMLAGLDRQFPGIADQMERMGFVQAFYLRERAAADSSRDRLAIAEYGALWADYVEALRRGERMEWRAAEAEYERYRERIRRSRNPHFRDAGEAEGWRGEWRGCLAHVRLLRAAALVRLGRDDAWPVDPYAQRPVAREGTDAVWCSGAAGGWSRCWIEGGRMVVRVGR